MIAWPKHRSFRFSLRTLFALMTLVGVAIAWRTQPPLLITLDAPQLVNRPIYHLHYPQDDENTESPAELLSESVVPRRVLVGTERQFRVPTRLTNVSRSRIWFPGYEVDQPFYEVHTRQSSGEEWKPWGNRYCGTGVRVFPLEPGKTVTFDVWVLPRYRGAELTVTLAACKSESSPDDDAEPSASFEAVSAPVTLK